MCGLANILFEIAKTQEIEKNYSKIPLDEKTKARIEEMAQFFSPSFPNLSSLALKGLIMFGLKDWQEDSKITTDEVDNLPRDQRMREVFKANNFVRERIKRVAKAGDKNKVDDVFKAAEEKLKAMF